MNNKKLIMQVLFYGSLWGLLEATIGYVLHFVPALIAGSIMFPIASIILYKAYNSTKSKMSLFYIGLVASAIKGVNLFLPQFTIFKTINPMMSIILESLVVVLVVSMLVSEKPVLKYTALPIASLVWRFAFIGWGGLVFVVNGFQATLISEFSFMFNFLVLGGLLSGAIATGLLFISTKVKLETSKFDFHPLLASSLLMVAVLATYLL